MVPATLLNNAGIIGAAVLAEHPTPVAARDGAAPTIRPAAPAAMAD
jgi:hypothetical protein